MGLFRSPELELELILTIMIQNQHLENRAHERSGDATTLGDVKMSEPEQVYSESAPMAFGASVQKRADKVLEDYPKTSK